MFAFAAILSRAADRRRPSPPVCAGRLIETARQAAYPGREAVAVNEAVRALRVFVSRCKP